LNKRTEDQARQNDKDEQTETRIINKEESRIFVPEMKREDGRFLIPE